MVLMILLAFAYNYYFKSSEEVEEGGILKSVTDWLKKITK